MLIREISDRTPGLNLRIAVARHLARHPRDLSRLAKELRLSTGNVRDWLKGRTGRFIGAFNVESLLTREKLDKKKQKSQKKKNKELLRQIKEEGVNQYANRIWAERKHELARAAASSLIDA